MSLLGRSRTALLALAVSPAMSVALVACDEGVDPAPAPGPSERPSGAARQLTELPGVASAEVAEELVEQDVPGTVVAVDVEGDIATDELAAVFARIDEIAPDDWVLTLDCAPAQWAAKAARTECDTATGSPTDQDVGTPEHGARVLLAAARRFPSATVSLAWRRDLRIDLADPGSTAVAAALDATRSDPQLRDVGDLTVAAARPAEGPGFVVTSVPPLSARTLALWRRLTPTLARLPAGTPGSFSVTVEDRGRVRVTADVQLPGVAPPDRMTSRRYGATLWPYLRAQLDVVAALPEGASYAARNAYRPVADGRPHGTDPFLAVTVGAPGRRDYLGRTWSVEAAQYLAED